MQNTQYPFKAIKILKDGVTIVPLEIEDTGDNSWKIDKIETNKPASEEMIKALQSFTPEIRKRLELVDIEEFAEENIVVQGVTIGYKDGFVGIKIHFRLDNAWFTGTYNSHLPFIYEYAGDPNDVEDKDDLKPFLTEEMLSDLDDLCKATQEYMKVKPKDKQLFLFGDSGKILEEDEAEPTND
jgi:hypothetical protein